MLSHDECLLSLEVSVTLIEVQNAMVYKDLGHGNVGTIM